MTNERDGVVNMLFHFEMMSVDIPKGNFGEFGDDWR